MPSSTVAELESLLKDKASLLEDSALPFDEALEKVLRSADAEARMAAANELQLIIQDEVPVLPMAETGSAYLVHPQLRGVVRRVLGPDPDYTFSRVTD